MYKKIVITFMVIFSTTIVTLGGSFTIVENGQSKVSIATPKNSATPEELEAIKELQTYIKMISGVTLPIKEDGQIKIGTSASAVLLDKLPPDAYSDAFVIKISDNTIDLCGKTPQGTLFAVYELLEKLGVRWYMPGEIGRVIPKSQNISLASELIVQNPSFGTRELQSRFVHKLQWYKNNKFGGLNFPAAHRLMGFKNHNENLELFKIHPEYFAIVDGKRTPVKVCVSNPEVQQRVIDYTIKYFDENPNEDWVGMGPSDGYNYCECVACQALDSGKYNLISNHRIVTDRYIHLLNKVCTALESKYPDKKIVFYAYQSHIDYPEKNIPHPNIVPVMAAIAICRIHGVDNPICPERSIWLEYLKKWSENSKMMFHRGYLDNLAGIKVNFSRIHALRKEIPLAYKYKLYGFREQADVLWNGNGLTLYIAGRLFWNHNTDVDAVLNEYFTLFYGAAEKEMKEYYLSVESDWENSDSHVGGSFCLPQIFSLEKVERYQKLFDTALSKVDTNSIYEKRINLQRMTLNRLEMFLTMLEARNKFDFTKAQKLYYQLYEYSQSLANIMLCPLPTEELKNIKGAENRRLIQAPLDETKWTANWLKRFWSETILSGYEREVEKGEIIYKFPDVWSFRIDPSKSGETQKFFLDGTIGGNWQKIKTFSDSWSGQGLHYYKGEAWYRTTFTISKDYKDKKIFLWFGGVDEVIKVWINGEYIGSSIAPGEGLPGISGTFKPVDFLVKNNHLRFDKENTIAVKVINEKLNEVGTGGIVAPVMLWTPKDNMEKR